MNKTPILLNYYAGDHWSVLLVDIDPQADLTTALGWPDSDALPMTLADIMEKTVNDEEFDCYGAILHHEEGVDLIPASIELSGMEMSLVSAMSREFTLRSYLSLIKHEYDHIFKVRMDADMLDMIESVKQYGVLVPALVRPANDGYQMIAGHRRQKASELVGHDSIPCIIRNLTDDEATIIMVDSNLQRERILPSEKAFAYKMKLDAMKRQQGERTDLTSVPLGQRLSGKTSRELLAEQNPDSNTQIQRFIRLTNLIHRRVSTVMKSRIYNRLTKRGVINEVYIRKVYGKSKQIRFISSKTVCPVGYVQTKHPMFKKKSVCKYTVEGREEIHENLKFDTSGLLKLMRIKETRRSIEYMDNRISLYAAQYGKCAVTGQYLQIDELNCHHKTPLKSGGSDRYDNLIIVHVDVHKLIHSSSPETITAFLERNKPDKKTLAKINELRVLAGNLTI